MYKPINICPLGLFIQNRIDDLMFDFLRIVGTGKVNQVCCVFWNCFIVAQFLYLRYIMLEPDELHIAVFYSSTAKPYIHYEKHHAAYKERYITSMCKFLEKCNKITGLYDEVSEQENVNKRRIYASANKVIGK